MDKENKMKNVIIALDFDSKKEVLDFLDQFSDQSIYVKIGMELFYGQGLEIVEEIKRRGHKIFLDLKLHDIPNTVRHGMKQLATLGVDMVNVHAAGGVEMMKAAIAGLEEGSIAGIRPVCIAVTQLTSIDQTILEQELWIEQPLEEVVLHYANNAKEAGLDGIVCSPLESQRIHQELGLDFLTVTPGIRLPEDAKGDQKRVTTPAMAKELTSSYIVVGRTITKSANPKQTYLTVCNEFA